MNKYRVYIKGSNFAVSIDGKVAKHGFFTTRFVEAKDSSNAETLALDLIRQELTPVVKNDRSDTPMMHIKEIIEIDDFGDNLVPGSGFTWFEEEQS